MRFTEISHYGSYEEPMQLEEDISSSIYDDSFPESKKKISKLNNSTESLRGVLLNAERDLSMVWSDITKGNYKKVAKSHAEIAREVSEKTQKIAKEIERS